ncbi:MAG TPA: hypothetical protein VJ521_02730, partial [Acidobacteriota bacterium]|nr:hypothetical protein [Acidobacteriota bacterium]
RVGLDAGERVYFSVSAMRTGKLDTQGDEISELWFGNAFLRALGSPLTTSTFHGNLFQANLRLKWNQGSAGAAGGYLNFDDDDSTKDNQRDIYHFYVEGVNRLMARGQDQLYAAARFSYINAPEGFPIVGHGDFGLYFFNPAHFTETIWRLSAGMGYRVGRHALVKAEYTFEQRKELNQSTEGENFLGAEVAFRF